MRVLHRVRYAAQFLERIELTFESDRILGPTFLEDLEILVADGPPLVDIRRVQRCERLTEPAEDRELSSADPTLLIFSPFDLTSFVSFESWYNT